MPISTYYRMIWDFHECILDNFLQGGQWEQLYGE